MAFAVSFFHVFSPSVLVEMGRVAGAVLGSRDPEGNPVWILLWRGSQTREGDPEPLR